MNTWQIIAMIVIWTAAVVSINWCLALQRRITNLEQILFGLSQEDHDELE